MLRRCTRQFLQAGRNSRLLKVSRKSINPAEVIKLNPLSCFFTTSQIPAVLLSLDSFTSCAYSNTPRSNNGLVSSGAKDVERRYWPRRAVMYVPASDERKTKKVISLKVDTIVFDLEDGVAVNQKDNARRSVRSAIANYQDNMQSPGTGSELVVRVNGVESGLLHADLEAILTTRSHDQRGVMDSRGMPDAIMLPKCDTAEQLLELDMALSLHRYNFLHPLELLIIIESPEGLMNLKEICTFGTQSAKHFRLSAVTFGSDDFLAALGGVRSKSAVELVYARQSVVTHAKAFRLDAIDMVDIDFKDLESLRKQAEEGSNMGYTGKQLIHPDQVPVVQKAFSPSLERVKWAKGLIEAFHMHQTSGKGAFVYEGNMIDRPSLLQAENIVKLHESSPIS